MNAAAPITAILDLDRAVHEPARLAILTVLANAEEVEFLFLQRAIGLTTGNLSSHTTKLQEAGYLEIRKAFRRRKPVTSFRITAAGRRALAGYWDTLRRALPPPAGGRQA